MASSSVDVELPSINWVMIKDHLKDLHRSAIKPSNDLKFCAIKIREFGVAMARLSDVHPNEALNNDRIRYIGSEIEKIIPKGRFGSRVGVEALDEMINLACFVCNCKNALQAEAFHFGKLFSSFGGRIKSLNHESLQNLIAKIPDLIEKIDVSHVQEGFYTIDATPFDCYLGEGGFEDLSWIFDVAAFDILSKFHVAEGRIVVTLDKLPSREFLLSFTRISDPVLTLLIDLLIVIRMDVELQIKKDLGASQIYDKELFRKSAEVYLEKEKLIPYFCLEINEKLEIAGEEDKPFNWIPRKDSLYKHIAEITTFDWLEQSSLVYDVLLDISKIVEAAFSKLRKKGYVIDTSSFDKEGADKDILRECDKLIEFNPPIHSRKPFCLSKEEFIRVPEYIFTQKISAALDEAAAAERPTKAKKPSKKSKSITKVKTPPKRFFERKVAETPVFVEVKEPEAASGKIGFLAESCRIAQGVLDTISIHPRVGSWFKSEKAGLTYYDFENPEAGHVLSREEMVLRHRFPMEILLLILNPFYSKTIDNRDELEEGFTKRKCIAVIDEKKYFIEAIIDAENQLFHFYGRPIRSLSDYVAFTVHSPSEFPALRAEATLAVTPEVRFEEIRFNPGGDALINFEGHEYKILLLKDVLEAGC